jgi:uncharacterized protein (TIGR02246 family)
VLAGTSLDAVQAQAQDQNSPASTADAVLSIVEAWTEAWNQEDLELMSQLHDSELLYYWRGRPRGYETFMHELREYIFPNETNSVELVNPHIQSVAPDVAIVGFQMRSTESATGEPEVAFTLGLVRRASGWKIIHVHESAVRE